MIKSICYLSAILLLLGALSLPPEYYLLLRVITFVLAGYLAYINFKTNDEVWMVGFGIIALIFNPIIPLYLYNKFLWAIIDISSALVFIIYAKRFKSEG